MFNHYIICNFLHQRNKDHPVKHKHQEHQKQKIDFARRFNLISKGKYEGPGFTFVVNELLTPPSDQAEELFAQFLSELDYYSSLGADIYTDFQLTDRQLTITYCIPDPSFSVVKSQIDDFLEYMRNSGEENDFLRDNFEIMFRDSLQENSNDIAEEIRLYCSK